MPWGLRAPLTKALELVEGEVAPIPELVVNLADEDEIHYLRLGVAAVLEEGIAANPESSLLGYKRAETLARAGRAGEAAEELRRVYVLDPATRKAAAGSDVFAAAFPDGLPG